MADVNYLALEASNQAGMDAAVAKFAELLKTFDEEAKATATIPPRRARGGRSQGQVGKGWMLDSAPGMGRPSPTRASRS